MIKQELANLSVDMVIWDMEDIAKQPPWGNNIAATITSLANYFMTSDGKDLIATFEKAIKASIEIEEKLIIRSNKILH